MSLKPLEQSWSSSSGGQVPVLVSARASPTRPVLLLHFVALQALGTVWALMWVPLRGLW